MNNVLKTNVRVTLDKSEFLQKSGSYFLVDGQYGSTGKGLAASVLAEHLARHVDFVTSNAGPNSGHTSYFQEEKIVLCQLPTFGVVARKYGISPTIHMNAGAVIDIPGLAREAHAHNIEHFGLFVSPYAAVADDASKETERHLVGTVGSTGKGTGAAIARKIMRDKLGTIRGHEHPFLEGTLEIEDHHTVFVEVSQGFSLGIDQGFYPYTTSRNCGVAQAMSDAGLHPSTYAGCMQVMRTFPIRVAGNSGDVYPDQKELTWEILGVEPELTTVTKKVRRVFTWSHAQYLDSLLHNRPEHLFLNFVNYLAPSKVEDFVRQRLLKPYFELFGKPPRTVLLGFGARNDDVEAFDV